MIIQNYTGDINNDLFALLLTADPDEQSIQNYLPESELLVARDENEIIGVAVVRCAEKSSELMNIAVKKNYQGRGVGKRLLAATKELVRAREGGSIVVGTGNSSLSQLAFYQKSGFRIVDVKTDFFATYPEPIVENGIRCIDKIILRFEV